MKPRHTVRLALFVLALLLGAVGAHADFVGGLNPRGDNFLALRAGPGTAYRMLRRLGPGTIVTVTERRGDWLKVELEDGSTGWVFGKYVLAGSPPGREDATEDEAKDQAPATTQVVAEDWRTYVSDRFGTAIDYPSDLFKMLPPAANDDGRRFIASGGEASFVVLASHNAFQRTLSELQDDDLASGDYGSVTYRRMGDDWYALSGYRGDSIFYRKVILAGEIIHAFEATYPRIQRGAFEPVIARMAESLSPGSPEPVAADIDVAAPAQPGVAPDDWRAPVNETLFDGQPNALLVPHQSGGGVFDQHARYDDGALVVTVPPNSGWGKVGLLTPDPVVWLDDFHDDAEVRVEFTLDPDRTSGLGLALAEPGWGGVAGNDPGAPSVRYYWIRKADGSAARSEFHVDPHVTDDYDKLVLPPDAPTSVVFVLRPGKVAVELDGVEVAGRPWKVATGGTGFRIYAFSHVDEVQMPVAMALRAIRISRRFPAVEAVAEGPAPGVQPLPLETLFEGAPTPLFEPAAVAGGNFDAFARYAGGELVVAVPAGNSWAKTGLISAEPIVSLDQRDQRTPLRLTLDLDPTRTISVVVALGGEKQVEMWPAHRAWLSFNRLPDVPFYALGLHSSPYNDRVRRLPAEWVDTYWDGTLMYEFSEGRACIRMSAGPALCADTPVGAGYGSYATILAQAPVRDAQTAMVLKRITRGWVTPPGMTAGDRWSLLDAAAFDPGEFLDELGSLLQ